MQSEWYRLQIYLMSAYLLGHNVHYITAHVKAFSTSGLKNRWFAALKKNVP